MLRVAEDAESRPPRLRRQSIHKLKVRHGPCIAGWSAAIEPTRPLLPRFVLLEPGNAMTKRPPGRPARYTFWRLGRFHCQTSRRCGSNEIYDLRRGVNLSWFLLGTPS